MNSVIVLQKQMCSTGEKHLLLPKSLNEVYHNFQKYIGNKSLSGDDKILWGYVKSALEIGRSLNSCIIVTAGISGTGKSSLINSLFDKKISEIGNGESVTHEVLPYSVGLQAVDNAYSSENNTIKVCGKLTIVDVPGYQDTNSSQDFFNEKKIQNFVKNFPALKRRSISLKQVTLLLNQIDVREKVYPNAVILVMKATDTRCVGKDSAFSKALRQLMKENLIDTLHSNFILVVTYAMSLGTKKKMFLESKDQVTNDLVNNLKMFPEIPMPLIEFVENRPEKYFDEEEKDTTGWFILPDGTINILNVFLALNKVFSHKDVIGQLFCGWYFRSINLCPDKNNPIVLETFENFTSSDDDNAQLETATIVALSDAHKGLTITYFLIV